MRTASPWKTAIGSAIVVGLVLPFRRSLGAYWFVLAVTALALVPQTVVLLRDGTFHHPAAAVMDATAAVVCVVELICTHRAAHTLEH